MTSGHPLTATVERLAPAYLFLGVQLRVLLSSRQTGGQFSMIEGIMPPGGDGGLHIHKREDESMFILEGELEVTIGDEVSLLRSGTSYFAPRGIPQRLRNTGSVPARGIVVTTPGGFDEFIVVAGVPLANATAHQGSLGNAAPTPERMAALLTLAGKYGIEILVPPGA